MKGQQNFRGKSLSVRQRIGKPGGFDARMVLNRKQKGAKVRDLSEKLSRIRQPTAQLNRRRLPFRLNTVSNPIFTKTVLNDLVRQPKTLHNFKIRIPNDKFTPGAMSTVSRPSSVSSQQPSRMFRVAVNSDARPIRRVANSDSTATFSRTFQQLRRSSAQPTDSPTSSKSVGTERKQAGLVGSRLSETKVAVANLHPQVSEEDVVELFGSAGALKSAKMVRPGTAEVVFFTAREAIKAIELYDQRELDGLPMQCSLVSVLARQEDTERPRIRKSAAERLKQEVMMDVDEEIPAVSKSKPLIPDRDLIAEVLSKKKVAGSRPVTFTVKV